MNADSVHPPKPNLTDTMFVVFLRLVAISCLWFGLQYWAMLVGYSLNGHGRFDLLAMPWKIAGSILAVVFPVAALGLWLSASWGAVIWTIGACTQILMYGFWTSTYGANRIVILMHAVVVLVYVLFRAALWLEARQKT